MRPIKFRAWDRKLKRFGYFHIGAGRIGLPSPDWTPHNYVGNADLCFPDVEEWQEFTGLHDRNGDDLIKHGKEIYEGDILEIGGNCPGNGTRLVVEWKGSGFYCGDEDLEGFLRDDEFPKKVIGNIYSNPELVK